MALMEAWALLVVALTASGHPARPHSAVALQSDVLAAEEPAVKQFNTSWTVDGLRYEMFGHT